MELPDPQFLTCSVHKAHKLAGFQGNLFLISIKLFQEDHSIVFIYITKLYHIAITNCKDSWETKFSNWILIDFCKNKIRMYYQDSDSTKVR